MSQPGQGTTPYQPLGQPPATKPRPSASDGARMLLPGLLAVPALTVVFFVFFVWWVGDAEARGVDTTAHGYAFFLVFPLGGLFVLDAVLYAVLLRWPTAGHVALALVNGGVGVLILLQVLASSGSITRGSVIAAVGGVVGALVMGASVLLMGRGPFAANATRKP